MHKNVGILADLRSSEAEDYARRMQKALSKVKGINVVIFYHNLCKVKPFETSMLSIDHLWGFSGTLFCLSASSVNHVANIASKINTIYIPDLDVDFDPLKLLFMNYEFEIASSEENVSNKVKRSIGDNIKNRYYSDLEELVRGAV